jgi:predicted lysophospholipase L1 biosynthesis ABC-type transport system permease subunit
VGLQAVIASVLIGLIAATFLLGLLYLALWELRLNRRVKRASWDLENARPGFLFDRDKERLP